MADENSDEPIAARLDRLEERLKAHRQIEEAKAGRPKSSTAGFAEALKLGSEFVAGVLVGFGIGWFFDKGFGTAPFGMIVFLMLGFAAGVLNVLRSQGVVAEPMARLKERKGPEDPPGSDDPGAPR